MAQVKIGALCWNQHTEWPALLQAGIRADELGFDTLWTWDQLHSRDRAVVSDRQGLEARWRDRRPLTARWRLGTLPWMVRASQGVG
jgi:hypothetical protein